MDKIIKAAANAASMITLPSGAMAIMAGMTLEGIVICAIGFGIQWLKYYVQENEE